MKNISLFERVKCIISTECDSHQEFTNKTQQEEIQVETIEEEDFHGFDIDAVFAN